MKLKMIISIAMVVGGLSLLLLTTCSAAPGKVDNSTVESLDLEKYDGVWYEIVRKPHFFEKGMTHVKTTYTILPDGKIEVRNEGIKNGKNKVTKGKARTTDTPGKLKVTFFIFPAQYNVLEVAPDYSYAVVGGSNGSYLWVLSRTPQMDSATLEEIYGRLEKRGYDLSDLIIVEQD
jgi:lipocalin